MKQQLLNFFRKRYIIIALTVFVTFFITRELYYFTPLKEAVAVMEKFGLNKYYLKNLPNGIVIGIVGVTSTYDSLLISMPYNARFHEFEVSIIDLETHVVHLYIVPLYAVHAFQLGLPVLNGNEEDYMPRPRRPRFNPNEKNRNI